MSFLCGGSDLEARGFPVQEIAARGPAIATETWLVDEAGGNLRRIATHRLDDIELGRIDPQVFSVPEAFRDLRTREPPRETGDRVVAFRRALRRRVPVQTARAPGRPDVQRRASSALAPQTMAVFVPSKRPPEIPIESCLPSTQFVPCAFEIRRLLCDNVKSAANLIGQRLSTVTGTRDPNGRIAVSVDWLQQLEDVNNARFDTDGTFLGDGLFCLLRDPPTGTSFGGTGLLDRAAEALAEQLVENESNLPLGGNDDPVDIPVQARFELAAITGDPTIRQNRRWDQLSPASQAAIREEVCKQRLGRFREAFAADVDNEPIPSRENDFLWVTLRAQGVDIGFDGREVVSRLVIRDENQVESRYGCLDLGHVRPGTRARHGVLDTGRRCACGRRRYHRHQRPDPSRGPGGLGPVGLGAVARSADRACNGWPARRLRVGAVDLSDVRRCVAERFDHRADHYP